ncbi:hypothetical protein SEA_HARVEYSR_68 [Mycobacterium phage HarveySr]
MNPFDNPVPYDPPPTPEGPECQWCGVVDDPEWDCDETKLEDGVCRMCRDNFDREFDSHIEQQEAFYRSWFGRDDITLISFGADEPVFAVIPAGVDLDTVPTIL